jgi:uncharacterized membrane protein YeiH
MLTTIEFMAVIAYACYGILLGCRKRMDVVGICAVAFAISFGGGTLRDLFLDRHPLFLIAKLEPYLLIPDALGLALFTVTGVGYALEAGTSPIIAAIMGVVTGTFGGVIADVLSNEIPTLFRSAPMYAICAFIGSWVYLGLVSLGAPEAVAPLCGIIFIFCLRIAAIKWDIRLPNASLDG